MLLEEPESAYFNNISHESDGSVDESSYGLYCRIKNIDLTSGTIDVDKVWKILSIEEKREFHRQLVTGSIYSAVPVWTPWWQSAAEDLVTSFPDDFLSTNESKEVTIMAKPLSKLLSTKPHSSVVFSLAETLLGFVFVSRYFNGDNLSDMCLDACDLLIKLVSYFQGQVDKKNNPNTTQIVRSGPTKPINFTNFTEVLASFQLRLAHNRLTCSHELLLLITDDLYCLLKRPDVLLNRALCDAEKMLLQVRPRNAEIISARRKVVFLRACTGNLDDASKEWCRTYLPTLAQEVEISLCDQTMRIEAEGLPDNGRGPTKPMAAGPNWRNIIREGRPQPIPSIEQLNSQPLHMDESL
ncbi:unnamed protein product [Mesocestoides corti]|uniref:Uncharacterized protein n=1 Tax=Mesocestoides corti TaxID=53468 RepID=A0A0R3UHX7_MESCO|nr:unnamed protein product [Mesocestoides corti]